MQASSFIRLCLSIIPLVFGGCCCFAVSDVREAAEQQQMENNLKMLGMAYLSYHDQNRQGPPGWQELETEVGNAEVVQAVRQAGYEFKWGVNIPEVSGIGTVNYVLAHRPQDLNSGGLVLFLDTSVRHMGGAELAAALEEQQK